MSGNNSVVIWRFDVHICLGVDACSHSKWLTVSFCSESRPCGPSCPRGTNSRLWWCGFGWTSRCHSSRIHFCCFHGRLVLLSSFYWFVNALRLPKYLTRKSKQIKWKSTEKNSSVYCGCEMCQSYFPIIAFVVYFLNFLDIFCFVFSHPEVWMNKYTTSLLTPWA